MWTFSWVSHFSHLWKIRQVHHHHKWLQTTSPPRMLTRAPCYHSKQRPIHRGTQKLLLFRAKLVVDNKGERKLVCGTLKTTISGQPSVQCILQQRLPKALNSGSQNVLKCLTINRRRVQSGAKALSSQMHTVEESQMDTPCTTSTNWWRLHQYHLILKIKMGDIWAT